jgi:hypothetical protein
MAILSRKITTYTQNIKDLADTPPLTAAQLKAFFDGRGDNELKTSINGIVDDLSATTDGSSGADQIGATPVKDGGAETVQGVLEELKDVDNHIDGSVNKVFTATEKTKLGTIAENAEVNTVDSVNTKTGAVVLDADDIDDTATTNKFTTATEKSKLAGIDENANAYVHPNHSGDVTSVGDGATTIAAKAVTLAKMADMATSSLLGRKTAGTGVPEVLSKADAQTLLNVEDGANNYVHPSDDGNLHVPANSTTSEDKVLTAGASAGTYTWETPTMFKNGSGTFTSGETTYTVTDAFITANTMVIVSPTSEKLGSWSVESSAGSFTITSDETETVAVTFDWGAVK